MADKVIYLDNAATTRVSDGVLAAMLPYFGDTYGNPSSIYEFSMQSKKALVAAREEIAAALNCEPSEIYFTSGGSEADNWALYGTAEALREKGRHIITTKVEHHAVLHACEWLEMKGWRVSYIGVDENGIVKLDELKRAVSSETVLISVMAANNEIGTLQPVAQIGKFAKERGICFHTDAVQAFGHIPMDVRAMNIDMLSASGHKLNGPKGIGFLYVRQGTALPSMIRGGGQERGRRAGTENVPGIVGFGQAVREAGAAMKERAEYECALRDYFMDEVLRRIQYARVNGSRKDRLPNNVNFSFQFIEGESLLIMLDMQGICASSGSACTAGSLEPSHVLMSLGLPEEVVHGSIRFTLSRDTTKEEIDFVIDRMEEIVAKLREMSPFYSEVAGRIRR
ncbi:MAG: cysteine desulfurase NifS [Lachnospiraceae bacterium]|nr:cysteine desulfurase NifS [Lachnospiraceae bacterium]